jgi:hypothetical protein
LECNRAIVVQPSAEPNRRAGLRRRYVVLTHAVCELTMLHSDELHHVELAGRRADRLSSCLP